MTSEQTAALLYRLARTAAKGWGLEQAELDLLQYEGNAVFRLTHGNRNFVLRLGDPEGRCVEEQRSEMIWLSAMREDGLIVPRPVKDLTGSLVADVGHLPGSPSRPCVLLEWIPGQPPDIGISTQTLTQIGALSARVHLHAERFRPPAKFSRPEWNGDTLFGPASVLRQPAVLERLDVPSRGVLSAALEALRPVLVRDRGEPGNWGLIHGDLHRDNILVDATEVGFIDFDNCGYGSFSMDLGALLESFGRRITRDALDRERLHAAVLEGYASCRALPADVEQRLADYVVVRLLVRLQFLLGSRNENVQSWAGEQVTDIIRQLSASQDRR